MLLFLKEKIFYSVTSRIQDTLALKITEPLPSILFSMHNQFYS